jgi:hypothetical protein
MAIGRVIDPQVFTAMINQADSQQNRNLEAQIADRKLRLASREMDQKAAMANAQGGSAKAQIEAMKEAGRMDRAAKALELKAQKEGRLGEGAEFLNMLREAQAAGLTGKEGRAQAAEPTVQDQRVADVENTRANTAKTLQDAATRKREIWEKKQSWDKRLMLMDKEIDYVSAQIKNTNVSTAVKKQAKQIQKDLQLTNQKHRDVQVWATFASVLGDKAKDDPDLKMVLNHVVMLARQIAEKSPAAAQKIRQQRPDIAQAAGIGDPSITKVMGSGGDAMEQALKGAGVE